MSSPTTPVLSRTFIATSPSSGNANLETAMAPPTVPKRRISSQGLRVQTDFTPLNITYASVVKNPSKRQRASNPRPLTPYPFEELTTRPTLSKRREKNIDRIPSPILSATREQVDLLALKAHCFTSSCKGVIQALTVDASHETNTLERSLQTHISEFSSIASQMIADHAEKVKKPLQKWLQEIKDIEARINSGLEYIETIEESGLGWLNQTKNDAIMKTSLCAGAAQDAIRECHKAALKGYDEGLTDVQNEVQNVQLQFLKSAETVDWLHRSMNEKVSSPVLHSSTEIISPTSVEKSPQEDGTISGEPFPLGSGLRLL